MKQIVTIDSKQKNGHKVLSVAAQVYGRAVNQNLTETGHFKNGLCTKLPFVASLCQRLPVWLCKSRAMTDGLEIRELAAAFQWVSHFPKLQPFHCNGYLIPGRCIPFGGAP